LFPFIPNFIFINKNYLLSEENRQNYSSFGYIGGGFGKKSTYMIGSYSYYSSLKEGAPKTCFAREQP